MLALSLASLCVCLSRGAARVASRRVARTHRARTVRRNRTARRRTRSTRRTRARTPVGGHLDRVGSLCVCCVRGGSRADRVSESTKFREECVGTGTRRRVLVETDSSRAADSGAISRSFAPTAAVLPDCVRARDSLSPPFYALLLPLRLGVERAAPRPTPLPRQAIDDRRLARRS